MRHVLIIYASQALPTGLPTQSSDVLAKRGLRKGQKCAKRGVFGICEWWQDVHGPSEAAAPETVERVEMGPFEPSEGTAPDN